MSQVYRSLMLGVTAGLACTFVPGTQALQQSADLQRVIANVKANEALYDKLEFVSVRRYESNLDNLKRELGEVPPWSTHSKLFRKRIVYQGKLFYCEDYEEAKKDRETFVEEVRQGYDGELTRASARQNKAHNGNVYHERYESGALVKPHTWLFARANLACPLSLYLQGGSALRTHKSGSQRDWEYVVSVAGTESVGGEECFRIRCDHYRYDEKRQAAGEKHGHEFLWLAIQKNYLPVRREVHETQYQLPVVVGTATDFREAEPGVWASFKHEVIVYSREELKRGERVWQNREKFELEKFSLSPQYDIALFRDIRFPPGTTVYEFGPDRKLKRNWVEGGSMSLGYVETSPTPPRWYLSIIVGIGLSVVVGGSLGYWRWRRQRRLTSATG